MLIHNNLCKTLIDLSRTSNQFVAHRVPAKDQLKAGVNEIIIHFESTFLKVLSIYLIWIRISKCILGTGYRKEPRETGALERRLKPSPCSQGSVQVRIHLYRFLFISSLILSVTAGTGVCSDLAENDLCLFTIFESLQAQF